MDGTKDHKGIIGVSDLLLTYGRHTPWHNRCVTLSYKDAMPHKTYGNHWTVTEYNSNNAWYVNFNDGHTNNSIKYSSYVVRPEVAYETEWNWVRLTIQIAFEDCCRGKSSSTQCQEYLPKAKEDMDALTTELLSYSYTPSTSTCFLVRFPKLREVFAAAFRDRIIHHWICLRMEPLFEALNYRHGNVTHNCRKGFGTKTAIESVYNEIKRVTNNYREPGWIFKGDLVGFFMSLPQRRMCDKLLEFARQNYFGDHKDLLLWLIEVTVMHRPEKNCILNSNPADWVGLTANKSLFRCEEGKGAPIGNLTTQLFANFYMSEFDEFVITKLMEYEMAHPGFKWRYDRFVDDFVIICNDKRFMMRLIKMCEVKLEEMQLTLHKHKRYIQPASHGVPFVGAYLRNGRIYLSNRTLGRFRQKIKDIIKHLQMDEKKITVADLEHIRATCNSYLGFCKGKQTYKHRKKIMSEFAEKCQKYFICNEDFTKVTLRKEYIVTLKEIV